MRIIALNSSKPGDLFFTLLGSCLLVSLMSMPLQVRAEGQSLSVSFDRYEEQISRENRDWDYEPQSWAISYSFDIDESWSVSVEYGQGEERKVFEFPVVMELDKRHTGITLSYGFGDYFVDAGILFSESELMANRRDVTFEYEEIFDSWDILVNFGYYLELGDWMLLPTIGLGFQSSDQDIMTERTGAPPMGDRDFPFITVTEDSTLDDSFYLSFGFGVDYPIREAERYLILAALNLGWTEPLSDGAVSTFRKNTYLRSDTFSSNPDSQSLEGEGSGSASASLSLLVEDMLFGMTVIEPIDVPGSGRGLVFDLAYSF